MRDPARPRRRYPVRTALAAGLALGAAAGAIAFVVGRLTRIQDLVCTFHVGGRLEVEWRTVRAIAGRVEVLPASGGEGRERRLVESSATREHRLEVDGLEPGRDYQLIVHSAGHDWGAPVNVPARPRAELRPGERGGTTVLLNDAAVPEERTRCLPGGDRLAAVAGRRRGERVEFSLSAAPAALDAGTCVEIEEPTGWRLRYRVRSVGELGVDLTRALDGFDHVPVMQRVIGDLRYDATGFRQSVAYLFGGSGASSREELDRRRRAPLGTFRKLVVEELSRRPWWPELEAFRPIADAFFGDAAAPIEHRVRLYERLLRLAYVELVVAGQGDDDALGFRPLVRAFVSTSHTILPRAGAGPDEIGVVLLTSPTAWFTEGYDQVGALRFWLSTNDFFPALFHGADTARPAELVKAYRHQRTSSPHRWIAPGAAVRLRARVALLAADHSFEVRFRELGRPAGPPLLIARPATPEWDAIATAEPGRGLLGPGRTPDSAGGREAAGPSVIRWGQIDLRFPAALIPPPPFEAVVSYAAPPGARSRKLAGQQPTAYLGSLTLSPARD